MFRRRERIEEDFPVVQALLGKGAALATVVGVLVEVPVMLSVCSFCNRTRHWFPAEI